MNKVISILDTACQLEKTSINSCLDFIYTEIDKMLWNGEIDEINKAFLVIEIRKYSIDILLALLITTMPVSSKISNRQEILIEINHFINDPTLLKGIK